MKKIKRDFVNTDYQNPRKKINTKNRKKKIILISVIFIILTFISISVFILVGPQFRIEQIEILGLKNIKRENIEKIIDQELNKGIIFKHNNIFLFNINTIEQSISKTYILESFEIEKTFNPTQISILLEEKVSALTYITTEECFNIDINGLIVEPCNELSNEFIQIRDESGEKLYAGDLALDKQTVDYIIKLNDELQAQGIEIRTYKLPSRDRSDLRVVTGKGFEIYLNMNFEIDEQLKRFNILVREEIGADKLNTIQYIDLRFGDKVFYK